MSRLDQTFTSVREGIAHLLSWCISHRGRAREGFYLQPPRLMGPVHSPVSSPDAATPHARHDTTITYCTTSIPLTVIPKVPAIVAATTEATHASEFSHGSGLLVYINGALMSAAHVALKINTATLEMVKRLPLKELGSIATCLGAAFGDAERPVDISWAEVNSETERQWREAEREWEEFSGGPFEALVMELEDFDEEAFLRRNIRRIQHARCGSTELDVLPTYSRKENADLLWSLGEGARPIMSSAELDELPNWSDVEDEVEWNGASGVVPVV